ncbi:MAG: hypothetical protein ABIP48_00345 [Planctomycetota bacterium]
MRFLFAWLPLVLLGVGVDAAFCQQSTTVQLPTYSSFSTRGSVVVPDRGSAYLGGVKRAAFGRNEFGTPLLPFRNRSFGAERSVSGASVSVYIHDFEAMDEYLLSQPTPFRRAQQEIAAGWPRGAGPSPPTSDVWKRRLQKANAGSSGPAVKSVAELRAERLRVAETRHAEALKWFKRGQRRP